MPRRLLPLILSASMLVACGGGEDAAPTTTTTSTRPTTTTTTTEAPTPRSSLTGEVMTDAVVRERPVVAVKFDNVFGRSDDQTGIAAADIVYEIPVEGAVTRLLALFQSTDATDIGPIRSARGSEIGLLEELHQPLYTWHGANAILRRDVRNSDIQPRSIDDIPQLFYRKAGRPSPYNSYAQGTAEIRATAPEGAVGPLTPVLTFADDDEIAQPPSPIAVPATAVRISFATFTSAGSAPVRYDWDEASGKWLRFQRGAPHLDGDGNQIAVDNVIVRFTQAVDSGTVDKAGSFVPTAVVTGEGEAWVFSRGTVTTGTWSKPDGTTRTTYVDQNGGEILLTPGTTWISLPYSNAGASFETAG